MKKYKKIILSILVLVLIFVFSYWYSNKTKLIPAESKCYSDDVYQSLILRGGFLWRGDSARELSFSKTDIPAYFCLKSNPFNTILINGELPVYLFLYHSRVYLVYLPESSADPDIFEEISLAPSNIEQIDFYRKSGESSELSSGSWVVTDGVKTFSIELTHEPFGASYFIVEQIPSFK